MTFFLAPSGAYYIVFSCENAAQQVLMSVCPSVHESVVNW